MALNRVSQIDDLVSVKNVLISLSDKTGLESFAKSLMEICPGVKFYSTGGTYQSLEKLLGPGHPQLVSISDYTGQPEMQGGLVKTLDFKICLGLLSETYNNHHVKDLSRTGGITFDLVAVNLYPFEATVAASGVTTEDARANIDIGGPTMLRAAAKNYLRIAAVCNPSAYSQILADIKKNGGKTSLTQRFDLAKDTFKRIKDYDQAISDYLDAVDSRSLSALYSFQESK